MTTPTLAFSVVSVEPAEETWKLALRARAKVRIADAVVLDLELIEGRSGIFLAYPSRREQRHGQTAWTPVFELVDREFERAVFAAVKQEYAALVVRKANKETLSDEPGEAEDVGSDLPF